MPNLSTTPTSERGSEGSSSVLSRVQMFEKGISKSPKNTTIRTISRTTAFKSATKQRFAASPSNRISSNVGHVSSPKFNSEKESHQAISPVIDSSATLRADFDIGSGVSVGRKINSDVNITATNIVIKRGFKHSSVKKYTTTYSTSKNPNEIKEDKTTTISKNSTDLGEDEPSHYQNPQEQQQNSQGVDESEMGPDTIHVLRARRFGTPERNGRQTGANGLSTLPAKSSTNKGDDESVSGGATPAAAARSARAARLRRVRGSHSPAPHHRNAEKESFSPTPTNSVFKNKYNNSVRRNVGDSERDDSTIISSSASGAVLSSAEIKNVGRRVVSEMRKENNKELQNRQTSDDNARDKPSNVHDAAISWRQRIELRKKRQEEEKRLEEEKLKATSQTTPARSRSLSRSRSSAIARRSESPAYHRHLQKKQSQNEENSVTTRGASPARTKDQRDSKEVMRTNSFERKVSQWQKNNTKQDNHNAEDGNSTVSRGAASFVLHSQSLISSNGREKEDSTVKKTTNTGVNKINSWQTKSTIQSGTDTSSEYISSINTQTPRNFSNNSITMRSASPRWQRLKRLSESENKDSKKQENADDAPRPQTSRRSNSPAWQRYQQRTREKTDDSQSVVSANTDSFVEMKSDMNKRPPPQTPKYGVTRNETRETNPVPTPRSYSTINSKLKNALHNPTDPPRQQKTNEFSQSVNSDGLGDPSLDDRSENGLLSPVSNVPEDVEDPSIDGILSSSTIVTGSGTQASHSRTTDHSRTTEHPESVRIDTISEQTTEPSFSELISPMSSVTMDVKRTSQSVHNKKNTLTVQTPAQQPDDEESLEETVWTPAGASVDDVRRTPQSVRNKKNTLTVQTPAQQPDDEESLEDTVWTPAGASVDNVRRAPQSVRNKKYTLTVRTPAQQPDDEESLEDTVWTPAGASVDDVRRTPQSVRNKKNTLTVQTSAQQPDDEESLEETVWTPAGASVDDRRTPQSVRNKKSSLRLNTSAQQPDDEESLEETVWTPAGASVESTGEKSMWSQRDEYGESVDGYSPPTTPKSAASFSEDHEEQFEVISYVSRNSANVRTPVKFKSRRGRISYQDKVNKLQTDEFDGETMNSSVARETGISRDNEDWGMIKRSNKRSTRTPPPEEEMPDMEQTERSDGESENDYVTDDESEMDSETEPSTLSYERSQESSTYRSSNGNTIFVDDFEHDHPNDESDDHETPDKTRSVNSNIQNLSDHSYDETLEESSSDDEESFETKSTSKASVNETSHYSMGEKSYSPTEVSTNSQEQAEPILGKGIHGTSSGSFDQPISTFNAAFEKVEAQEGFLDNERISKEELPNDAFESINTNKEAFTEIFDVPETDATSSKHQCITGDTQTKSISPTHNPLEITVEEMRQKSIETSSSSSSDSGDREDPSNNEISSPVPMDPAVGSDLAELQQGFLQKATSSGYETDKTELWGNKSRKNDEFLHLTASSTSESANLPPTSKTETNLVDSSAFDADVFSGFKVKDETWESNNNQKSVPTNKKTNLSPVPEPPRTPSKREFLEKKVNMVRFQAARIGQQKPLSFASMQTREEDKKNEKEDNLHGTETTRTIDEILPFPGDEDISKKSSPTPSAFVIDTLDEQTTSSIGFQSATENAWRDDFNMFPDLTQSEGQTVREVRENRDIQEDLFAQPPSAQLKNKEVQGLSQESRDIQEDIFGQPPSAQLENKEVQGLSQESENLFNFQQEHCSPNQQSLQRAQNIQQMNPDQSSVQNNVTSWQQPQPQNQSQQQQQQQQQPQQPQNPVYFAPPPSNNVHGSFGPCDQLLPRTASPMVRTAPPTAPIGAPPIPAMSSIEAPPTNVNPFSQPLSSQNAPPTNVNPFSQTASQFNSYRAFNLPYQQINTNYAMNGPKTNISSTPGHVPFHSVPPGNANMIGNNLPMQSQQTLTYSPFSQNPTNASPATEVTEDTHDVKWADNTAKNTEADHTERGFPQNTIHIPQPVATASRTTESREEEKDILTELSGPTTPTAANENITSGNGTMSPDTQSTTSSNFSGSDALSAWWQSTYAATQDPEVNSVVQQALTSRRSAHSGGNTVSSNASSRSSRSMSTKSNADDVQMINMTPGPTTISNFTIPLPNSDDEGDEEDIFSGIEGFDDEESIENKSNANSHVSNDASNTSSKGRRLTESSLKKVEQHHNSQENSRSQDKSTRSKKSRHIDPIVTAGNEFDKEFDQEDDIFSGVISPTENSHNGDTFNKKGKKNNTSVLSDASSRSSVRSDNSQDSANSDVDKSNITEKASVRRGRNKVSQSSTHDSKADNDTTSRTRDSDTATRTRDSDTATRTRDSDTASRTRDSDTASRTRDSDTVSRTRDSDTVSRTRDSDTASRTRGSDTASKTRNSNSSATNSKTKRSKTSDASTEGTNKYNRGIPLTVETKSADDDGNNPGDSPAAESIITASDITYSVVGTEFSRQSGFSSRRHREEEAHSKKSSSSRRHREEDDHSRKSSSTGISTRSRQSTIVTEHTDGSTVRTDQKSRKEDDEENASDNSDLEHDSENSDPEDEDETFGTIEDDETLTDAGTLDDRSRWERSSRVSVESEESNVRYVGGRSVATVSTLATGRTEREVSTNNAKEINDVLTPPPSRTCFFGTFGCGLFDSFSNALCETPTNTLTDGDSVGDSVKSQDKQGKKSRGKPSYEVPALACSTTSETINSANESTEKKRDELDGLSEQERQVWDDWDKKDESTPSVVSDYNSNSSYSRLEQLEERQRRAQHLERRARAHEKLLLHAYSALSVPPPDGKNGKGSKLPIESIEERPSQESENSLIAPLSEKNVALATAAAPPLQKQNKSTTVPTQTQIEDNKSNNKLDKKRPTSPTNQQQFLEKFTLRLKDEGMEVLKLNRDKKWQIRYLTVSKEVTSGDRGYCPQGLLWLKKMKGKDHSVNSIDKQGKGGMILTYLLDASETPNIDKEAPLSKKQQNGKFKDSIAVTLRSTDVGSTTRAVVVRCQSKNDALFLCTGCNIIVELLKADGKSKS